jgi:hypothetical protein
MMEVPKFVLHPKSTGGPMERAGEVWIDIEDVEPGSILAQAVVRTEREHEACSSPEFGLKQIGESCDSSFYFWRRGRLLRSGAASKTS